MNYRGYIIERKWTTTKGRPQPDEFTFCHSEYDGPPNPRCGFGWSEDDCKAQIDDLAEEDSLSDWLDAWEQAYADGQTRISRQEAIRRWEEEQKKRFEKELDG